MTKKTVTSDTTQRPKADNKKPRKVTGRLDPRKKRKLPATNGKILVHRGNAREKISKAAPNKAPNRTIRTDFDLGRAAFARMTGVAQDALARWEQGKSVRLDDEAQVRISRVASILERFARVMQREFIPTWLEQPNEGCKEIGARTPLELFERGELESLEDMAWYLESGTPG